MNIRGHGCRARPAPAHPRGERTGAAIALALALALLGAACSGPEQGRPHAGQPPAPSGSAAGQPPAPSGSAAGQPPAPSGSAAGEAQAAEIERLIGPVQPAQREEARALAAELAADWRREASGDKDADAILALLRDELARKLGAGADKLEVLRAEVLDRRARALSRRSLALGKAVIDHAIPDAEARATGEQILREVAPLAARVRALRDPEVVRVLSQDLQEVSLEATYAVERGAMSRRLSDYQAEKTRR